MNKPTTPNYPNHITALFSPIYNPATAPRVKSVWDCSSGPVEWMEREFYIPETKGAIVLEEYQRALLQEIFTPGPDGLYKYSTVVWSDIKKSMKSTIAAAIGLYVAVSQSWASVKVVANDLKQADSRVAYYMRNAIQLNPRLKQIATIRNYNIEFENYSKVEAIPVDPKGEAGGNDDLVIFSELWAANNEAYKRLWTELTLSPTKYGRSMRWVETYAGFSGESVILEQLYSQLVKDEFIFEPLARTCNPPLEVYHLQAARMIGLWNTVPRCKWQTPEYYAQERANLGPAEFDRVHGNKWGQAVNQFITKEEWAGCISKLPILPPNEVLVGAIDAGVSSDNFAVVVVNRVNYVYNSNQEDELIIPNIFIRFAKAWIPPKGGKLDFEVPGRTIRALSSKYNIVEWAFDPYQLHQFATDYKKAGVGNFREFSQTTERAKADNSLLQLIRGRRIRHNGSLEQLNEHIRNAFVKTEGEQRLRLVKHPTDNTKKIDLAVALSMASHEALRLNIGEYVDMGDWNNEKLDG